MGKNSTAPVILMHPKTLLFDYSSQFGFDSLIGLDFKVNEAHNFRGIEVFPRVVESSMFWGLSDYN
ncbi:MAG: hypothetical protein ABSA39_07100 [Edaphobacter sp.]